MICEIIEYILSKFQSTHEPTSRNYFETFLVARWIRIHLLMQGTGVWSLVQENSICHRATKLVCHSYLAHALEPMSHNYCW